MTDADDGDNSACLFMLQQHADSEFFYVAPSTGALHSKVSLLGQHREQFEITVNATDNWGKGQSAQVTIKVHIILLCRMCKYLEKIICLHSTAVYFITSI